MTRLFNMICSAAIMLSMSSTVFAQMTKTDNMNNNSCDKPKNECMPCKPCKPCCFFEQGMALPDDMKPPCDVKYHPGYNAAAAIKVACSWDFNADASFIYWNYSQGAMDLAVITPDLTVLPGTNGEVVQQETGYAPGFKLGLGWDTNFDNWALNAEYTWLHNSQSGSATNDTTGFPANMWFANLAFGFPYPNLSSTWKMHMDMLDVQASRPFYEGTHLTISPAGGLRALWLRQEMSIELTGSSNVDAPTKKGSVNNSHSWAIGPKACINTHWIVWNGLRVDGVVGSSLLYTRYTAVTSTETEVARFTGIVSTYKSKSPIFSAVRPTLDMGLGLGYGAYMFSNKFFFDLAVRYDFSQFWTQNVMRAFASQLNQRNDLTGDLAMHGLTITLRCDF